MGQLRLLPAFGLLASCGPIQSGALIVDAAAELSAAQTSQAEKHAPFEFVAAEEYLHKAREEQSYAEFERAVDFARKSFDCARVARARAEEVMRREIAGDAAKEITGGPTTKARCRPGPERLRPMLDPDQEPAAQPIAQPGPQPVKRPPQKAAPKKEEPKDPPPERTVVKPKEETPPLPEGDE